MRLYIAYAMPTKTTTIVNNDSPIMHVVARENATDACRPAGRPWRQNLRKGECYSVKHQVLSHKSGRFPIPQPQQMESQEPQNNKAQGNTKKHRNPKQEPQTWTAKATSETHKLNTSSKERSRGLLIYRSHITAQCRRLERKSNLDAKTLSMACLHSSRLPHSMVWWHADGAVFGQQENKE